MTRCPRWLLLILSAAPLAAQSPFAAADSALAAGQAWRASQIMAPVVAAPETRTPEAVILAARAAAAWEGWATVRQLLANERWLDSRFDRLGRRLLAQADLAESRNTQAVADAIVAAAGDSGRSADEQGRRLILVARAYDRLDQLDSAAANYRRAMKLLPQLDDWLALRAAGVTRDSAARAALYALVALPAAVPRIPWTEALARDRSDDIAGAASRYDALGAHLAAIKVRWRGATGDSDRTALIATLADLIRTAPAAGEVRDALDFADQIAAPFSDDDRLAVARRAVSANRMQDAVDQFATAMRTAPLDDHDRMNYAAALGGVGRWTDASAVYAAVTERDLAGAAAYDQARALLRAGAQDAATAALRAVVRRFPRDTFAAATALALLADLATDDGAVDSARSDYLRIAGRYPTSTQRPHAVLLAALIALETGRPVTAAGELERALASPRSVGAEADAMRYWLGRARERAHNPRGAGAAYRDLLARGPENYYAMRAAVRLDTMPWPALPPPDSLPPDSLNGVFARAAELDTVGLAAEARFERDRIATSATGSDAERVAESFAVRGFTARAVQLAGRARTGGASRDAELWRLLYPLPDAGTLRATALREQVDPWLVASVIRQESAFDPHATSRADARGLMQVTPATGRDLANILGLAGFDPALLWVSQVNLALGIHHFATDLALYPDVERGLAAYNAGVSRVDQWSMTPLSGKQRTADHARDALADPEVFVERIPFVETRDYVRTVLRNQSIYRMVYGNTN
ncbi:MAG: transglycosylase SLT domain-containing protein [Gemmatimonadales bacterium]